MKKFLALLLVMILCFALVACGGDTNNDNNDDDNNSVANTPDTEKGEGVATHAEYVAAAPGDTVTVECYVQGNQSWWDNKITVYAQDAVGGYLFYEMACSEADAAKLIPGTKIRVTGERAEYKGEIELMNATFEFIEGANTYVADAKDVSEIAATDALEDAMNMKAIVKNFVVVGYRDTGAAFSYKDGVNRGDDVYFQITDGVKVYNMTVEKYLTDENTDVYKAVEALKVGDIVDIEFFAYWYDGLDAHVTSVKVNGNANDKSEGVATHAEYVAAAPGDTVTVECYVQGNQSWWDNKITVYAQDMVGGYLFYEMACSEADAAKLTPGTKIRVTGERAEYKGEIELMNAAFEFVADAPAYIASVEDITDVMATDALADYMNMKVCAKALTVVGYDGGEAAFQYKDGVNRGDDIYFQLSDGENVFNMTVEKYLTDENTDVYKAVEALKVGDIVDVEFFAYWYDGLDAHVTSVTVKTPEA